MSAALSKAMVKRVRGQEVLTGDTAEAQQELVTMFGDPPKIRKSTSSSHGTAKSITFYQDTGVRALRGEGIGEVWQFPVRFFIWTDERDGDFIANAADALERLFSERRGAPALSLEGYNRVFNCETFTALQEIAHENDINEFYGTIAFAVVEARP